MTPDSDENLELLNSFIDFSLPTEPHPVLYPNGWMSSFDLTVIYNAARKTKGDVLEVGPWLGRSTTAISSGLRDRELEDSKSRVLYDIIDFGITSPDEWFERFGIEFRMDHDKGRVAEAILQPGGSNAVLVNNLKKLGLLRYTNTIMRGDLITSPIGKKYDFIFCDALHSIDEIHRTMPKLAELMSPKCTLVADDVVTEEMAECVASYINPEKYFFSRTKERARRRKVCVFAPKS